MSVAFARTGRSFRRRARTTAMSLLLARYLSGQFADHQWEAISVSLDAADEDAQERAALAAFLIDASSDLEDIFLPAGDEAAEFLAIARA